MKHSRKHVYVVLCMQCGKLELLSNFNGDRGEHCVYPLDAAA